MRAIASLGCEGVMRAIASRMSPHASPPSIKCKNMQRTASGAASNGLYTTIKCMRGAAGIGLGTTIKHLRRTRSGTAGIGLGATVKYLRRTKRAPPRTMA